MTKKKLKQLEDIQYKLSKAVTYLKRSDTFVCSDKLPHALSYYDKHGKGLTPMNKEIGSDLCYLYSAFNAVTNMILAEKDIKIPETAEV